MNFEAVADAMMTMHWQIRIIQTVGLMCFVLTGELPKSQPFKEILKIVQQDLEQFNFRGGGAQSISDSSVFIQHRDILHDLYYPVMRVTGRRAAGNSLPGERLEFYDPNLEPISYQELDNYILSLFGLANNELDSLLSQTTWIWGESIIDYNQT